MGELLKEATTADSFEERNDHCNPIFPSKSYIEGYDVVADPNGTIVCIEKDCEFQTHDIHHLRQHLAFSHGWRIRCQRNAFNGFEHYRKWKSDYESNNNLTLYPVKSKMSIYINHYHCSLGKREHMVNGRKQITNTCTFCLTVKLNKTNRMITVELMEDHYGHHDAATTTVPAVQSTMRVSTPENEVIDLNARSGADKVQFENMFVNTLEESRKKLVMQKFTRMNCVNSLKSRENDLTVDSATDAWLKKLDICGQKIMFIHKMAHQTNQMTMIMPFAINSIKPITIEMEGIADEKFFMAFMSDTQRKLLVKYPHILIMEICKSGDINPKYVVIHLFVLDRSSNNVIPVAFCCTTGNFNISLRNFFKGIKLACGYIKTSLMLSNSYEDGMKEWANVFDYNQNYSNSGFKSVVSPWHVRQEFNEKLNSCMIPKSDVDKFNISFIEANAAPTQYEHYGILNGIVSALNTPSTRVLVDFISEYLITKRLQWATCHTKDYKKEVATINDYFTEINRKRLNKFVNWKIGRCIYLVVQYHKLHTKKKELPKKCTGKQIDPIMQVPAFERLEHLRSIPEVIKELPEKGNDKCRTFTAMERDSIMQRCDVLNTYLPTTSEPAKSQINRMLDEIFYSMESSSKVPNRISENYSCAEPCTKRPRIPLSITKQSTTVSKVVLGAPVPKVVHGAPVSKPNRYLSSVQNCNSVGASSVEVVVPLKLKVDFTKPREKKKLYK